MTAQRYEDQLAGLLSNMDAKARRELAREIAKQLRQSQQRRIAAQLNPDGSAFEKRKPQIRERKGKLRRTMFAKLRTTKYLKTEASGTAAVVGFVGEVERIARVHQYGLRDRAQKGGPEVQYPARQLLGFTEADIEAISTATIKHLAR
ncbi:phage virion morphogenesis (putative tail completion) protein [Gulbenkiania indica]|uniref:Phage virion morphogenesis (Putative tail completion) protein n=1 Tax=Gulbenkiania indica TaxID=375574 RepID=A0A0K6GU92_9NEIS|nr:phage virion morphogenesis protein [Gulbenkiania indica]CUA82089.1 phage virion morphogenesis (putative tail completion) protein [Gulbenkiania indica]